MAPEMTRGDRLHNMAGLTGTPEDDKGWLGSGARYLPFLDLFFLFFAIFWFLLILPVTRRGHTQTARAKHNAKVTNEKGRTIPVTIDCSRFFGDYSGAKTNGSTVRQ